jgi:hypothetical protein
MSDEKIKIPITGDYTILQMQIEELKRKLSGLGSDTETKVSPALKGFSFATKEAAHQLGVSGPMARLFGHEAMDMAGSLGKAGVAFGALGIAALAAYKVYEHFAEARQKEYDDTMKRGEAAVGVINSLIDEGTYTDSLREKILALNEAKNAQAAKDLDKAIQAQKEHIAELNKELAEGGSLMKNFKSYSFFGSMEESVGGIKTMFTEMRDAIGAAKLKLDELNIAKQKLTEGTIKGSPELDRMKLELEIQSALYKDNQKMLEDDRALKLEIQAALYKDNQKTLADTLANQRQYNMDSAALTVERMRYDQQEAQAKQEALYNTASFMSSSLQAIYQAGGAHARKSFSLFKMAASAEAMINADRAAASSYAWGSQLGGPGLGAALAALAYVAGIARVQSIRAMTLEGGGGAGGSVPTYSVSPTTGETSTASTGPSYTFIIEGQRYTAEDLAREIDRNHGIIGNLKLSAERV